MRHKQLMEYKDLIKEWDYNRNEKTPESYTSGSNKKVWWICHSCGYSWRTSVINRTAGHGCPQCARKNMVIHRKRKVLFVGDFPEMLLHYSKENDEKPDKVRLRAKKSYIWTCDHGHIWKALPKKYQENPECPVCGHPERYLISYSCVNEYDMNKNSLDIRFISSGSKSNLWWKCSHCSHEWRASPSNRCLRHTGCPACSKRNHSNIQIAHSIIRYGRCIDNAKLMKDWDFSKNTIDPAMISKKSMKKVHWKCHICGNEWVSTVNGRYMRNWHCPSCESSLKIKQYFYKKVHSDPALSVDCALTPALRKEWFDTRNPKDILANSHERIQWKCERCGHIWKTTAPNRIFAGTRCPQCQHHTYVSREEQEIASFVKSILPHNKVLTSCRNIIYPNELDIYIPSKKIAIEFNGLYWHSERMLAASRSSINSPRLYHYNKWLRCQQKGIQLITIWEDDWRDRQDIVKSMLAYKMGLSGERRVFARRTSVMPIDGHESSEFLDRYHIQGAVRGSLRYGLYDDRHVLVAVGVFRHRNDGSMELSRYATSCSVVGGMGKILHRFHDDNPDFHRIITFADHTVSDGGMYERLGFVVDGELKPDYMYVVDGSRVHKFNYRLKRFRDDPDLLYKDGMSESGLALMNGLDRVYDAGKTRYVLTL